MADLRTWIDLITEAVHPPTGTVPSAGMLIIVHPGSACGSADSLLGRSQAQAERDGLVLDCTGWRGAVIVIDGDLSDELPSYPALNSAVTACLQRASGDGFVAERLFACDSRTRNWPAKVARLLRAINAPPDTRFKLTGAWYFDNNDSGCVNAVQRVLTGLGYHQCTISDNAVRDPDGVIGDDPG